MPVPSKKKKKKKSKSFHMEFLLLKNSTRKPSFKKVKPGRMTQMVEHLPSKHEDLSSIPNTGKK
jgi:hypothetical protein